jgi:hypothetical protein
MTGVPPGEDMRATYENIIVKCPLCGRENIFNRATDLKGVYQPIDYAEVSCLFPDCAKSFSLGGDVSNSAYEMLIFDCYELLDRKHYSYCILNLAQAFEVFFSQYLRVELLYRPFGFDFKKKEADVAKFSGLMKLLYQKIENFTFRPLRNLFFYHVLHPPGPSCLRQAETAINGLQRRSGSPLPPDDSIRSASAFSSNRVPEILVRLKSCNVPDLRNSVVHKGAYRPTLGQVNDALKETRAILFPLGRLLDVRVDNVNWYTRQRT